MISDRNHFIVTYFEFTGAQGDSRPEVAADRLSMTHYNYIELVTQIFSTHRIDILSRGS